MYKQSIQNIEVVVLSLDGVILDLNRMRYNYYNCLCKENHIQLEKIEFHQQLSNMYDMYNNLPLHNIYESGILNAKIERELLQYLEYTGVKVKDGVYELIEYFHQKDIKIAVVSTHHTKNAVTYLKLANLYKKVHFIIGSDSKCLPLPSNQMLEVIKNHFQVETHHILVVSSFLALQKAANASKMNVIHCDDFVETTIEDKQSCYKCVPNVFEVLNTLLFDKYVEETMYSSILGMNQTMSQYELDETYKNLNQKYADDKDVLDIVDQTYQYHSSQINEHHIKDINPLKTSTTKKFIFDDEENKEDYIEVRKETKKEIIDKIIEKNNEDNIETSKETKEEIIDKIIEKNNEEEHIAHVKQLNKDEENELSELLKQIQKKDKINTPDSDETIKDFKLDLTVEDDSENVEDNESKEDSNLFVNIFLELISAILSSFCILFMGIAIAVLLMHQWGKGGFIGIIEIIYNIYNSIVTMCFSFIFNTLHNCIDFIPTYSNYINENPIFSNQGVNLLNIFIFNTGIIFITKVILVLKEKIKNVR